MGQCECAFSPQPSAGTCHEAHFPFEGEDLAEIMIDIHFHRVLNAGFIQAHGNRDELATYPYAASAPIPLESEKG